MRNVMCAVLGFVAAIGLMLAIELHRQMALPTATAASSGIKSRVPAQMPAPADSTDASDDDAGDADNWPKDAPSPEQVMYAQPALLRHALDDVRPRQGSHPNVYLLAFAGDGGQSVFRNEAEYAAQLFATRFGAQGHTLVLENHPGTLATKPLADWSNLETALDGLAKKMNTQQDILVLYLTSHGSADHTLLVDMDPLSLDQIGADDLADILKAHPFKWKVVVINACYSGGFLPPLRGPDTLVMTAARSDRSSFGCGSDADLTYFGKAWLVNGLNRSADLVDAFHLAQKDIAHWESQDRLTPSRPQLDEGAAIAVQLKQWQQSLQPGPALPFKAAAAALPPPAQQ